MGAMTYPPRRSPLRMTGASSDQLPREGQVKPQLVALGGLPSSGRANQLARLAPTTRDDPAVRTAHGGTGLPGGTRPGPGQTGRRSTWPHPRRRAPTRPRAAAATLSGGAALLAPGRSSASRHRAAPYTQGDVAVDHTSSNAAASATALTDAPVAPSDVAGCHHPGLRQPHGCDVTRATRAQGDSGRQRSASRDPLGLGGGDAGEAYVTDPASGRPRGTHPA